MNIFIRLNIICIEIRFAIILFYKKGGKKIAKIKGPLFSFEASGKLAKTLIYRHRKKVKDVKEYIKPYNPKTDDQDIQRDYLKNAVLAWKVDGYSVLDIEAWNLYASIQKKNLSGYNIFLGERINANKVGETWTKLTNCIIEYYDPYTVDVFINIESDKNGMLYYGTSKYSMLNEIEGYFYPEITNFYYFMLEELLPDTRYYFYIKNKITGEVARTGIYKLKTLSL